MQIGKEIICLSKSYLSEVYHEIDKQKVDEFQNRVEKALMSERFTHYEVTRVSTRERDNGLFLVVMIHLTAWSKYKSKESKRIDAALPLTT